nr:hypothetical protein GCM10020093_113730 [Planobispora longispora]
MRLGGMTAAVVTACATVLVSQAPAAAVTGPPPQASSFDHALYWNGVLLDAFRQAQGSTRNRRSWPGPRR